MRCPFCGDTESQVKDSRPSDDQLSIRRRRMCSACNSRFTTFERVQLCELTVVKKDGEKVPFDRAKIDSSIKIALRKRPVPQEKVDRVINSIVRRLEAMGESEIKSSHIGEVIMETLKDLDKVAYVRFASVYRDFREAKDFEEFIDSIDNATV